MALFLFDVIKGITFGRKSTVLCRNLGFPVCRGGDKDFCARSLFERGSREAQGGSGEVGNWGSAHTSEVSHWGVRKLQYFSSNFHPSLMESTWSMNSLVPGACPRCGLSRLPGQVERCEKPMVCTGMSAGVAWGGERGCVWVEYPWHLLPHASPFSIAQGLGEFQRERKPGSDRSSLFSPFECVWLPPYPLYSLPTRITILHAASSLDSCFLLPWGRLEWFLQGWHDPTHTSAKSPRRQVWSW